MDFIAGVGEILGGVGSLDRVEHLTGTADGDDGDHGYRDEGGEHQTPLRDVGERGAEEAAEQRVAQRDSRNEQHAQQVRRAEGGFEEHASGDHARGHVEREEHQDDHPGRDPKDMRMITQPVLEETRHRDRVVGDRGVGA